MVYIPLRLKKRIFKGSFCFLLRFKRRLKNKLEQHKGVIDHSTTWLFLEKRRKREQKNKKGLLEVFGGSGPNVGRKRISRQQCIEAFRHDQTLEDR